MENFICQTCGTQFAPTPVPPPACPICEDERQYVGWEGQQWTTPATLAAGHGLRIGDDAGLLAIDMAGRFAIPQRVLLLPTAAGNILWESLSLVTDEAIDRLRAQGGVDRIVISHPHFYSAMTSWSEALGGVPIMLHAADRSWVQQPARAIEYWRGDTLPLGRGITLIRTGGHFPGSTVLHWDQGPRGRGALFVGDSPQVKADRQGVSFMYSDPNHMPLPLADVRAMEQRLAPFDFDDVYGFSWGRNIIGGGHAAVQASFDRYLATFGGDPIPGDAPASRKRA